MEARDRRPGPFIVFECLETQRNTKPDFFNLLLQRIQLGNFLSILRCLFGESSLFLNICCIGIDNFTYLLGYHNC